MITYLEINPERNLSMDAMPITGHPLKFTEVYEMLLNDTVLGESELMELHKLILKKLVQQDSPSLQ